MLFDPRTLLIACALSLAACQGGPGQGQPLVGSWGGEHVRLVLTPEGGTLEYDCAAGAIEGPVVPDASGRFTVRGAHTPALGGPIQEGEVPHSFPADYVGRVRGARMSLEVRTSAMEIGSFELERDATPSLFRCL